MIDRFKALAARPFLRWSIWLLFAALFYRSGETFTSWVMEPAQIKGGLEWLWIALFPVLLPAFFVVNRRLGCASGSCAPRSAGVGEGGFPGH